MALVLAPSVHYYLFRMVHANNVDAADPFAARANGRPSQQDDRRSSFCRQLLGQVRMQELAGDEGVIDPAEALQSQVAQTSAQGFAHQ